MKNRDLLVLLLISLSLLMIAIVIYIQQLLIRNKKAKKIVEEINTKSKTSSAPVEVGIETKE